MNRKDLSFLDSIFIHNNYEDYQILIINQTSKENILKSKSKNIRVINSFDLGLSKSRNLALKNAIGDICLIADDDVEYVKGFDAIVREAYNKYSEAECILFNSYVNKKSRNPKYLNCNKKIFKIKECVNVCSVEISFKRECIQSNDIQFNELLGLNSHFIAGEELVFLNEIFKEHRIFFYNKIILRHEAVSTGGKLNLEEMTSVLAVQYYLIYPDIFYLKIIKLIVFLNINGRINIFNSAKIFGQCINARREYLKLLT
jgi:glycosyltransferase involved in cell wall biosynthesis